MLDPRIKDVVSGSDRDRYPQIENFHASRVAGLRSVLVQQLNDMAVGVGDVDLLNVVVTDARPTHPFKSAFAHHCEERLKRIHHDREVMAEARAQFLTTPFRSMAGQPSRLGFLDYVDFNIAVMEVRSVEHKVCGPVYLLESEDVDVEIPGVGNVGDNKAHMMHAHGSCGQFLGAGLEELVLAHGGPFCSAASSMRLAWKSNLQYWCLCRKIAG